VPHPFCPCQRTKGWETTNLTSPPCPILFVRVSAQKGGKPPNSLHLRAPSFSSASAHKRVGNHQTHLTSRAPSFSSAPADKRVGNHQPHPTSRAPSFSSASADKRVGNHRTHLTSVPHPFRPRQRTKGWETTKLTPPPCPILSPYAAYLTNGSFVGWLKAKGQDTRQFPACIDSNNALESARVRANFKTLAVSFMAQQKGHGLRAHALIV